MLPQHMQNTPPIPPWFLSPPPPPASQCRLARVRPRPGRLWRRGLARARARVSRNRRWCRDHPEAHCVPGARARACVCACVCVCRSVSVCMCVYAFPPVFSSNTVFDPPFFCALTITRAHTHTHTNTHTHTYTHALSLACPATHMPPAVQAACLLLLHDPGGRVGPLHPRATPRPPCVRSSTILEAHSSIVVEVTPLPDKHTRTHARTPSLFAVHEHVSVVESDMRNNTRQREAEQAYVRAVVCVCVCVRVCVCVCVCACACNAPCQAPFMWRRAKLILPLPLISRLGAPVFPALLLTSFCTSIS